MQARLMMKRRNWEHHSKSWTRRWRAAQYSTNCNHNAVLTQGYDKLQLDRACNCFTFHTIIII